VEGGGQIVVTSGTEAANPIINLCERAENKDRRLVLCLAQRFHDAQTVDAAGKYAIEDHHVVLAAGSEKKAIATIIGVCTKPAPAMFPNRDPGSGPAFGCVARSDKLWIIARWIWTRRSRRCFL
jgi:hypothetical protein